MGWITQSMPFQVSAEASSPPGPPTPTAAHTLRLAHDTASSPTGGLGAGWSCQLLPFQRSGLAPPTAVQAVLAVHETLDNSLFCTPLGLGVGWTFQRFPFQRSTSAIDEHRGPRLGSVTTQPNPKLPTAVQAVADVHDTARRLLYWALDG